MRIVTRFASAAALLVACNAGRPQTLEARAAGAEATTRGAPSVTASFRVPELRGYVNDNADLLTPPQEAELSEMYRSVEREIGCQIVLLTIESLPAVRIEDYSLTVANTWALGRKGIDDGVLITLAVNDETVRIEVGTGLELVISDDAAAAMIRQMTPQFATGAVFQGLKLGSVQIVQAIHQNVALVGKKQQ